MSEGGNRLNKLAVLILGVLALAVERLARHIRRLQKGSDSRTQAMGAHLGALSTQLDSMERRPEIPRLLLQLAILITVFVVLVFIGARLQPENSPLGPFAQQDLIVEVPAQALNDQGRPAANSPTFVSLLWAEAHGEPLDGYNLGPTLAMPSPGPGTVRILLIVAYDGLLPLGSRLDVAFDIPRDAELQQCKATPGWRCDSVDRPPSAARSSKAVQITGTVPDFGGTNGLIVVADLKNLPGLAFSLSRTRASVRHPILAVTGTEDMPPPGSLRADATPGDPDPYVFYPPSGVLTQVIFKSANDFEWSQETNSLGTDAGAFAPVSGTGVESAAATVPRATWAYQEPLSPQSYLQPHISGTNPKAIEDDADSVFKAGIIFGVAGSAVINALQLLVADMPRRKTRKAIVASQVSRPHPLP